MTDRLDWDTETIKHYVRLNGWLPAAIAQLEECRGRGRPAKYLTFCAAKAIDVFLFLREGILTREEDTDKVAHTFYCEKDPEQFDEIAILLGAHDEGFLGEFDEMVLFEDDDETRGKSQFDVAEQYKADLRERLTVKERHQRFRRAGPFDIINLDAYGNFMPPRKEIPSPRLRAIQNILDWQSEPDENGNRLESFTLFMTTFVEPGFANTEALEEFVKMVDDNKNTFRGFEQALVDRFGVAQANDILNDDFVGFYTMAVPKTVIGEAFQRGWQASVAFSGVYKNVHGRPLRDYWMHAWVARFEQARNRLPKFGLLDTPSLAGYAALIESVTKQPVDVVAEADLEKDALISDLADVVARRSKFSDEILSRD